MAIRGARYQGSNWKAIQKLLKKAATDCVGDPKDEQSFVACLLRQDAMTPELIKNWCLCVQEALGNAMTNRWHEEKNQNLSLAIELVFMLREQPELLYKPLEKYRNDLLKQGAVDADRCRRNFNTVIGRFLSDLRYIADAAHLTAATGRQYSQTRMRALAKVDELNNAIERYIDERNVDLLAEILGMEASPLVIARARRADLRPQMILDADRVLRARQTYDKDTAHHKAGEPKAPELPTNKYSNVHTPEQVEDLLRDLGEIELHGMEEESSLDWLARLDDVLVEGEDGAPEALFDSPGSKEQELERLAQLEERVALRCLRRLEPVFQKALFWRYRHKLAPFMSDEENREWLTDNGKRLSEAALARMAGTTEYLFKKALNEAEEQYKACLRRRLGHWLENDDEN